MRHTRTAALLALMVFVSAPMTAVAENQTPAPGVEQPQKMKGVELPGDVADCIRQKRPWSDCYNLLPDVKKVDKGFVGFHEGVYAYDDKKIGSIWVPTPAELITHAGSRKY